MLKNHDLKIIKEYSFPDHHFYSNRQLTKITDIAAKSNALVVTTEKDFVKIPVTFRKNIFPIDIELNFKK